ncbi:MAG TPA: allantoinase AllB [bacterium]|nr:allantoinase AllB [bacterium]
MLVITNATIPEGVENDTRKVHLVIDGEAIRDILPAESRPPRDGHRIDASDLLVLPGAIDPHVHFDTPGYTHREDFTCGSMSAAAGGVTTVIDMPDTSIPPVTDRASLMAKLKAVGDMAVIDFALWGGMSGNELRSAGWRAHLRAMKLEGVVGIKCYLLSGMRSFEHLLPLELVEVMRRAQELGMVVGLHAEDRDLVTRRTAGIQTTGRQDANAYYEARCEPAEHDGVRQGAAVATETGCSLHVVHVGSARAAQAAIEARRAGADITLETCPHFLAFSHEDLAERGSILKTAPVLKTKDDCAGLWKMLADGGIDFVASDHAPCPPGEKETGSIWTDYNGISGTETLFPYIFSEGYVKGRITLARLVDVTSSAAAKRYGLYPRKGSIAVDTDADLVFVDPERKWKVEGARFGSKGKLTPFDGARFTGRVVRTMCRGIVVYEEGKGVVAQPGFGRFIRRGA